MDTVLLREFVDATPACAQSASLKTALCFLQNSEQIVVVDEQQQPIGLLHFRGLMPYWLEGDALDAMGKTRLEAIDRPLTLQQLIAKTPSLLKPLVTLPLQTSQRRLQADLQNFQHQQYVLVDGTGRFWGLLDRLRLLQFLVTHPLVAPPLPPSVSAPALMDETLLRSTAFTYLIEMVEHLPLPLMLQTSQGEVITQNLIWRQQVGEMQDPIEIQQEAAVLLGTVSQTETLIEGVRSDFALYASFSPQRLFCQVDDENSCICFCPMKDGQERVWKFVKLPLLASSSCSLIDGLTEESPVSDPALPTAADSSTPFQLATLELDTNLAWRRRVETIALLWQKGELWLVLAQDRTEQQQAEKEAAAKNADLVQLNRLKDEFLASISHELKTPLTAILGLSSLLKDQSVGRLNDRQIRYAQLIHHGGRHLVLVVNDILDLTRIETGKLELILDSVRLESVCVSAYKQAQQLYRSEEIPDAQAVAPLSAFDLAIEPGLEEIVADELRLRQMLSNLLSNALKFTPSGGAIGLKVERWAGWIALTVWDTGIGIPTDKQHLIFQKFQQLNHSLTRRFAGTGLGLVLTQQLARLHGGDVTFASAAGQGSQFTILLPPSQPCANRGSSIGLCPSLPIAALKAENRLVVVVEAVPRFMDDLTDQLGGLGYRVAIARSGTEALEKARRLQPGAVFLNPVLPLLSGWDVLTLLKSDAETRHIPVIVIATPAEKRQASRHGADGFVVLPVRSETLQKALEPLLSQSPVNLLALTVLHLWAGSAAAKDSTSNQPMVSDRALPVDLPALLHPHHCRILEVDDLDQAELLARVWKPDVVLLDGLPQAIDYFKQLSQQPFLSTLPLVTLTPEATQAANQIPTLTVFPCLAVTTPPGSQKPSALLQVLQVAAGIGWAPQVLLVDLAMLVASAAETKEPMVSDRTLPYPSGASDWLQATAQYLRAAGFQSRISAEWTEVFPQLQHQTIDLLLLWVHPGKPHPTLLRTLKTLMQLETKPPILILQSGDRPDQDASFANYLRQLSSTAIQVQPDLPLPQLLEQISRLLKR